LQFYCGNASNKKGAEYSLRLSLSAFRAVVLSIRHQLLRCSGSDYLHL